MTVRLDTTANANEYKSQDIPNREVADAIYALVSEIRALRQELQAYNRPWQWPQPQPGVQPVPYWQQVPSSPSPYWTAEASGMEGDLATWNHQTPRRGTV